MVIDNLKLYRNTEGFTLALLHGIKEGRAGWPDPGWGVATAALMVNQLDLSEVGLEEDTNVSLIWTFICQQAIKVQSWDPFEEKIGKGLASILEYMRKSQDYSEEEIKNILRRVNNSKALKLENDNIEVKQTKEAYAGLIRIAEREELAWELLEERARSGFSLFAFGHTVKPGDNQANAIFLLPFFINIPQTAQDLTGDLQRVANTDAMKRAFRYIEEAWDPKGIESNAGRLQKAAIEVAIEYKLIDHIMDMLAMTGGNIYTKYKTLNNRGRFLSAVLDRLVTEGDPLKQFSVDMLITNPSHVQFCLNIEPWKTLIRKHIESNSGLLKSLTEWWETSIGEKIEAAHLRLTNLALIELTRLSLESVTQDAQMLETAIRKKINKVTARQWSDFLVLLHGEFQTYEASGLLRLSVDSVVLRSVLASHYQSEEWLNKAVEDLLRNPQMEFSNDVKNQIRKGLS